MRPTSGLSSCAARHPRATTARGPREVCARCAARRFARIWTTWITESLAEDSPPRPEPLQGPPARRWLKYVARTYHEPAVQADRPPFEDLYREYLGRIHAHIPAQVGVAADAQDGTA